METDKGFGKTEGKKANPDRRQLSAALLERGKGLRLNNRFQLKRALNNPL